MPPKVKKGGKKIKQKQIAVDDVDTTTLSRKKLEEFCVNVDHVLNEEKHNSEILRLERDKLVNMVAISREHLKMVRGKNRETENEIRDAEDEHRTITAYNRQRVIHLKNELENKCLGQNIDTKRIISDEVDRHEAVTTEVILDINELKRQIRQIEKDFHSNKVKIEKQQAENICVVREKNKKSHILSETKREKEVKDKTTQLQIILSAKYNSLLRLKQKEYRMFLDSNEKITTHLKHYYNRIVYQNQDIMEVMKNEIQKARESLGKLDKQYLQLKDDTLKLTEELCKLDREKCVLQEKLASSEQHKHELKKTKGELQKRKIILQDLKIEQDVQDMIDKKKDVIQKEENILLSTKLFESLSKMQSIILVIELFLLHLYNKLSEINANLSEIKDIYEKKGKRSPLLGSVFEYHDPSLDSINYEIAEIVENRNYLFRAYRNMLKKFDIPFENTGFKPLRLEEILAKIDNPRILVIEDHLLMTPMLIEHLLSQKGFY